MNPVRQLRALLRGRNLNLTRLAAQAGVSRCHLSEVLTGKPAPTWGVRGGRSRKKIIPHLTDKEREVLGW